jgi:hypothetical protein
MSARKTIPSEVPDSAVPGERPVLPRSVRAIAHKTLCSFSKMLTDRKKSVLHSMMRGLSEAQIAMRLQGATGIESKPAARKRGGARSLPLAPESAAGRTLNKSSGARPSFRPLTENPADSFAQEANAS